MDTLRRTLLIGNLKPLAKYFLYYSAPRCALLRLATSAIARAFRPHDRNLPQIVRDKIDIITALERTIERGLDRMHLDRRRWTRLFDKFSDVLSEGRSTAQEFERKHGMPPPGFITLSPTQVCNLHCVGCYAASAPGTKRSLSYSIVDRIVREQKELWGSHFTVISGGEPFMWRSEGRDILDLVANHPDTFFLIFSNGTLITEKLAARMADAGNLTVAISVEGMEAETDARRGKGVHRKILGAFAILRDAGVPFGISITTTKLNIDTLLTDEPWNFYLEQQGALYAWGFQYMPIGRAYTLELMLTPQQRLALFEKVWHLIRDKHYFVPDFWNCGTATNGCISAGTRGGYLYINWDGEIMPCVFNPYSVGNIKDYYTNGGSLTDALFTPYFVAIRNWQQHYIYDRDITQMGNTMAPCPIRDHYEDLRPLIEQTGAVPEDEPAAQALQDEAYREGLIAYGRAWRRIAEPVWRERYIGSIEQATQRASAKAGEAAPQTPSHSTTAS